jgi:hypothetical protein
MNIKKKHFSLPWTINMSVSTPSDYEYINEAEIDDELICVICQEPFEFPVSLLECNHTFCKKCIQVCLARNHSCPTCRQIVDQRSFQSPAYVPINTRIVSNQLDRLLIRCLRCSETNIQRCHWKNHEKICLKKIISCPSSDIKCTWEGSRDALSIHLKDCTFQQVRPVIDELKNELKLAQKTQLDLEYSVKTLEKKVHFLLKFINHGNIMTKNCTKSTNECKYNNTNGSFESHRFNCSICHAYIIQREQISLHACSGGCICVSCVNSQYSDGSRTRKMSNEEYTLSDHEQAH